MRTGSSADGYSGYSDGYDGYSGYTQGGARGRGVYGGAGGRYAETLEGVWYWVPLSLGMVMLPVLAAVALRQRRGVGRSVRG
jgi:hypothetical protein